MIKASPRVILAASALLGGTAATYACAAQREAPLPAIKHVFVIVLENEGFDTTFRRGSRAPYLADSLRESGAFLTRYYGIGHLSLPNYLAMIAGVPPTRTTQVDCPHYNDFVQTGTASDGQPVGDGCVYPAHVATIANQLEEKHLTWRAFMEDMGKDPARESATCGHPQIGVSDPTERATPTDQYAAKHDPFVYFHAIIDSATCGRNVVPLDGLTDALTSVDRTPNYSFIAPNLCHDGHDKPCKNGEVGSLASADGFLREWIPRIMDSPAYKADGLIIIAFDEALSIDPSACCDEPSGPNTRKPGVNGPGGGRTGAILLSPFIKPGTVSDHPYNHYSMLRTVEDIFGLSHLGYAGQDDLARFGSDIFNRQ
jgi:phosphatidylinositol-3-phosphatase